eukprot:1831770-Prymnesium_polylepis.1
MARRKSNSVTHQAKREGVDLARDGSLLLPLLRGPVGPVAIAREACEAKVAELRDELLGEEHIGGLEILVNDALRLEMPQPRRDADRNVHLLARIQRTASSILVDCTTQVAA